MDVPQFELNFQGGKKKHSVVGTRKKERENTDKEEGKK